MRYTIRYAICQLISPLGQASEPVLSAKVSAGGNMRGTETFEWKYNLADQTHLLIAVLHLQQGEFAGHGMLGAHCGGSVG